jgi:hypothetical protein
MCCMYAIKAMNFVSLSMFGAPSHAYFITLTWLLMLALYECVCRLRACSFSAFERLTVRPCVNLMLTYIRCVVSCEPVC